MHFDAEQRAAIVRYLDEPITILEQCGLERPSVGPSSPGGGSWHRIVERLEEAGVMTIMTLVALRPDELKDIHGLGEQGVAEIMFRLGRLHLVKDWA